MASSDVPTRAARGDRHIRLRRTNRTAWSYFRSIKAAANSDVVREIYKNPDTARALIARAFDQNKPVKGLIIESFSLPPQYRTRRAGSTDQRTYHQTMADMHELLFAPTYARPYTLSRELSARWDSAGRATLHEFEVQV